jgi:hypothetical protein
VPELDSLAVRLPEFDLQVFVRNLQLNQLRLKPEIPLVENNPPIRDLIAETWMNCVRCDLTDSAQAVPCLT